MIRRIVAAILLTSATAVAQTPNPATAKPLAFEVVSIHPSPPNGPRQTTWGTLPDGYRTSGQSLWSTIMIAYFPQGLAYWTRDRLTGAPPWVNDLYDITAKVSEADLPPWTKQNTLPLEKKVFFQQMLQSLLADRCKLVVHRVPGQLSGFALVVGKRGPHLTAATPGATLPTGMKLQDGGIAVGSPRGERLTWTFHSATPADLVSFLSLTSAGHPVLDKTGLTGNYDFVLRCAAFDPDHPESCNPEDASNPLTRWDLDPLGLHLEPINIPTDTLVIDHIEKPSEN